MTTTNMNRNNAIYKRRRLSNALGLIFAGLSIVFYFDLLRFNFIQIVLSGSHALLTMPIFTQDTPSPNEIGGLRNAIIGSIMVTGLGLVVGITDWCHGRYLSC